MHSWHFLIKNYLLLIILNLLKFNNLSLQCFFPAEKFFTVFLQYAPEAISILPQGAQYLNSS